MDDAEFRRVTDYLVYQFLRDRVLYGKGMDGVDWKPAGKQRTEFVNELNKRLKEVGDE